MLTKDSDGNILSIDSETTIKEGDFVRNIFSVKETAEYCGVSISTVYDMVRTKEIPHTRVRNRIIFHRDVLDHWLRGGEK